jgi:hypothetical protein
MSYPSIILELLCLSPDLNNVQVLAPKSSQATTLADDVVQKTIDKYRLATSTPEEFIYLIYVEMIIFNDIYAI